MDFRMLRGWLLAVLCLSSSAVIAHADSYTFSLIPANGAISGIPGSVIGWGYQITNNSTTDWLSTLSVNAGIFQHATLDSGDYFDFPIVAPGATVTVAFTEAGISGFGAGLAALTWGANAPIGFTDSGNFDLSACFANSAGACVLAAPDAFAAYSATVVSPVPEPPSFTLLSSFLFILLVFSLISKASGSLFKPVSFSEGNKA